MRRKNETTEPSPMSPQARPNRRQFLAAAAPALLSKFRFAASGGRAPAQPRRRSTDAWIRLLRRL